MIDTIVELRSGAIGVGGMVEYEMTDAAGHRILIQGRSDHADASGFDSETRGELALALRRIADLLIAGDAPDDPPTAIVERADWGMRVRHRFFVASKRMDDQARASFFRKKRAYFRALAYRQGQRLRTPAPE